MEGHGPCSKAFHLKCADVVKGGAHFSEGEEKIEEKLAAILSMNPAKKKFRDVTNYYGQMAEMDAQDGCCCRRSRGSRQR